MAGIEKLLVFLGVIALLAIPFTALAAVVRAARKDPQWKNWARASVGSLVLLLVIGGLGRALEGTSGEAAVSGAEESDAVVACQHAINAATDPNVLSLFRVGGGGEPVPPAKNADGAYIITDVVGGPSDVAGGAQSRWVATCRYKDGAATVLQPYKMDGYRQN